MAEGPLTTVPGRHVGAEAEGGVVGRTGSGKIDALPKITGRSQFVADMKRAGMVHCKVLRSPHAHARIVSLDASRALAMPGVLDVLTGEDVSIRYGAIPVAQDETALALGTVRYVGEPVACVAATTEAIAWEAARAIDVVYETLEPVRSVADALDADKPLIHPDARKPSNILRKVRQSFGDVDAAFAESDVVLEGEYHYPGSTHVPLETHAALAEWDGRRMTLFSSTQNPHYMHRTLARVLELPLDRVRVIKPDIGAGYGGKCDTFVTDVCSCVLARRLGRPVRFVLEREEVFYAHRGRHPVTMWLKMGAKKDGTITAVDFEARADGGAYASYGVVTAFYLGVFMTLPYQLPNYRFTSWRAYTNKPPCGPKRGHGAIQPRFALELHLEKLALELGMEPDALRLHNMVEPGHVTVNGLQVTSVGMRECIEAVVKASGYHDKRGKLPPGKGIGLAASTYMCGALHAVYANDLPHSGVQLKVDRSGRVTCFSGTADVGQGSNHMLAALVSERLGLSPEDVTVVEADTDLTPVDLGSYSSRVTYMAGNAALEAADRIRDQIVAAVAEKFEVDEAVLTLRDGEIHGAWRAVRWVEAVELAEARFGTLGSTGSYTPPKIGSRFRRQSVGPSPAYSYTAQVAEVSVDLDSGELTVDRVWVAHDLGRTLHREIAEGQIEGCVYMGVGEALAEEQSYLPNGAMKTPSLLEYRIPTVDDTPEIHTLLIESHDPGGPFGAKEAGEGPQLSTAPAIAAALHDAIGVWGEAPPYTPDKVYKLLRRAQRTGS